MRRLERLGIAVLGASLGCALRVQPVPIPAHLDWALPKLEAPEPARAAPRLGVGRFADTRRASERAGQVPRLRLSPRGLVREGDNRIGDAAFTEPIAEGVRRDVIATLARSGDFSLVRPIDFDGSGWPERAELEFALVGSIEEFAASQYQRSELSPFWVGWLRSRYEPPVGRVRVRYRLYSAEGLVWQARLETTQSRAELSITQAALEAMAQNSEKLAARVRGATGAAPPARVLETRVLDGCHLGPGGVLEALEDAVGAFEREASLRLALRPEPWMPPAEADLGRALREVAGTVPPEGGIVLALMPLEGERSLWRPDVRYGMAQPFGAHAIVGCSPRGEVRSVTAIHEIGHLLGAVHVRDAGSVMHPVAEFDARFFDPLNRRILRATRDRPFGAPLPDELVQQLDAIYRAAARFPESVEGKDVQAAQDALREKSAPRSVGASASPR